MEDAILCAHVAHRLMAEPANDKLHQRTDVLVRFADEHTCHGPRIVAVRRDSASGWYESGVNVRPQILVVDDDENIRLLLRELLERAGYSVTEAADGRTALRHLFTAPPALVILDVTMPDMDGYQTLERVRDLSDVPVLMLTARTQELEKVRGLSAGADDYVAKPFGRQELLARVQALLRRTGGKAELTEAYADDYLQIDYAQRHVQVLGTDVQLTPLEFKLLSAFVQNPNQVLSRDQLLEIVWGDPYGVSGDQVKLYVGYLRKKLRPDAPETAPIETVRGFGYRYRRQAA
jgi:DNA-binding response OmpR family regulator